MASRHVFLMLCGPLGLPRVCFQSLVTLTVTYVSNIYKYYVSYLLIQGEYIERRDLKKTATTSNR